MFEGGAEVAAGDGCFALRVRDGAVRMRDGLTLRRRSGWRIEDSI